MKLFRRLCTAALLASCSVPLGACLPSPSAAHHASAGDEASPPPGYSPPAGGTTEPAAAADAGRVRPGLDPLSSLGVLLAVGVPLSALALRRRGGNRERVPTLQNARTRLNFQLAQEGWHRELQPVGDTDFGAIAGLPLVRHCLANLLSDHFQRVQPELVEAFYSEEGAMIGDGIFRHWVTHCARFAREDGAAILSSLPPGAKRVRINYEPPENKLEKGVIVDPDDRPGDGTSSLSKLEHGPSRSDRVATQQRSLASSIRQAVARGHLGRSTLDSLVAATGARGNIAPLPVGGGNGFGTLRGARGW